MAMIQCKECGKEMSSKAKACPSCGAKNKKPLYKRVWFWLIVMFIGVPVLASLGSGGNKSEPASISSAAPNSLSASTSSPSKSESTSKPESKPTATYQSILDDYSERLRAATPGLIEEYNDEAKNNTDGLTGLAEISNGKITKLAEISNDGISEMAEIMMKTGSGKYSEYEEWAKKLVDVYTEEAQKIMDAYIASAK